MRCGGSSSVRRRSRTWARTCGSWPSHEGDPVVLEQGNLLVSSFHPELIGETGLHRYLLSKM